MKYKAVIFDLDGTLLDTLDDIADGVNYALTAFGYPTRTVDEVRRFVGNGAVKLLERALPESVDAQTFARFYATYDEYYTAHSQIKTAPYPGVLPLLRTLREHDIHTAVFSNKQDNAVRPLCASYFGDLLDYATGPTEDVPKKPDPQGLFFIANALHTKPQKILYVGDSETDVLTARHAGFDCVTVLWGFRDKQTLMQAGAVRFAETVQELQNYILSE